MACEADSDVSRIATRDVLMAAHRAKTTASMATWWPNPAASALNLGRGNLRMWVRVSPVPCPRQGQQVTGLAAVVAFASPLDTLCPAHCHDHDPGLVDSAPSPVSPASEGRKILVRPPDPEMLADNAARRRPGLHSAAPRCASCLRDYGPVIFPVPSSKASCVKHELSLVDSACC